MQKGTICVEDLEIGMSRMLERQITQNDIVLFSQVSGDKTSALRRRACPANNIWQTNCARYANCKLNFGSNCRTVAWAWDSSFKSNAKIYPTCTSQSTSHNLSNCKSYRIPNRRVKLDCKCKVNEKVVLAGEAIVLAPSRKFD